MCGDRYWDADCGVPMGDDLADMDAEKRQTVNLAISTLLRNTNQQSDVDGMRRSLCKLPERDTFSYDYLYWGAVLTIAYGIRKSITARHHADHTSKVMAIAVADGTIDRIASGIEVANSELDDAGKGSIYR